MACHRLIILLCISSIEILLYWTKRHSCGKGTCDEGVSHWGRKEDRECEGDSNQNTLYACMNFSKNKFSKI